MKKTGLPDRFREYIDREKLILPGQTIVIGLSGGADSVCLFNLLSDISTEYDLALVPVHVHHGIRGDEADRDEEFSKMITGERGVDCEICSVDAPGHAKESGMTLEEAARILRYGELERIAKERNADAIAIAHHRDDQAETVLMNLFRGTGATGLSGIRPRSGNRIRPILFASKKEILEYLKDENITFVEDSTNFSKEHTRNRIRSELIPMIEELYPQAVSHIASAAEDVRVWREFIDGETRQYRHDVQSSDDIGPEELREVARVDRESFLRAPRAIREEWIRQAVASVIPARKDVGRDHYLMLLDLLESDVTGRRIDLPANCYAERTYEGLVIGRKSGSSKSYITDENTCFTTELFDADIFNEESDIFFKEKDYTKYIDYDKINNGLVLRHPREGDYFILDENGAKKKLSRFYIDNKVPKELRAESYVIADGSHVVWALPDRLSEYYKVTKDTKRVLKISREGEGVPVGKDMK